MGDTIEARTEAHAVMKILLQHPHRHDEISGVVTFVENAARALTREGHKVRTLLSAEASASEVRDLVRWADVLHLNSNHFRSLAWAKVFRRPVIQHYHFPFWGTWKTTTADRELTYWGCFRRSFAVPWSHGEGWRVTTAFGRYFGASAGRILFRTACAAMADMRLAPTYFIRQDAHLPHEMKVVRYPIDFEASLSVGTDRAETSDFPDLPCFTFVGRVTPAKGPQLLIEAAAHLRQRGGPFQIYIVGDGELLPTLKARVSELSLNNNVTFTGRVSRADALAIMSRSTAVVVPSQWDDPSPYTVLEAAALRRPVIGTAFGGIPEIIGPGILLTESTPEALADAMYQLNSKAVASAMGEQCYDFVFQNFHSDRIAEQLIAVYTSLIRRELQCAAP